MEYSLVNVRASQAMIEMTKQLQGHVTQWANARVIAS